MLYLRVNSKNKEGGTMKDTMIYIIITLSKLIVCNIICKEVPGIAITDVRNKRVEFLIGEVSTTCVWLCADGSSFNLLSCRENQLMIWSQGTGRGLAS